VERREAETIHLIDKDLERTGWWLPCEEGEETEVFVPQFPSKEKESRRFSPALF
jgi:hypothetical protein